MYEKMFAMKRHLGQMDETLSRFIGIGLSTDTYPRDLTKEIHARHSLHQLRPETILKDVAQRFNSHYFLRRRRGDGAPVLNRAEQYSNTGRCEYAVVCVPSIEYWISN